MGNPFKIIDWITSKNKPIEVESPSDGYNAFIINRHFSYFIDLVFYANEMNSKMNSTADSDIQFDFYYNLLKKQKRFAKWAKPGVDEKIKTIMEFYSYSREKASQVSDLFSDEQIKDLRTQLIKGGLKKNK
jgi:hypothetical protein